MMAAPSRPCIPMLPERYPNLESNRYWARFHAEDEDGRPSVWWALYMFCPDTQEFAAAEVSVPCDTGTRAGAAMGLRLARVKLRIQVAGGRVH